MFSSKYENKILELKAQRKKALSEFGESRLVKNEALAEYFYSKFKEGKDITFNILEDIPVGEALLLPVVYGGAIITTKESQPSFKEIIYNTKWTPGSTLTLHYHSDCNESIIVNKGRVKLFVAGGTQILIKGDRVEIAAGVPHQVTALEEAELKVIFRKIL